MDNKSVFDTLVKINVNDHTEKKKSGGADLTYLSWPWAWSEVKKLYPTASYEIIRDPVTHLPYSYDPLTGFMCFTTVTIEGITHSMWLPVMDGANQAMKAEPYTYEVKNKNFQYAKFDEKKGGWFDRYGNEQMEFIEKHVDAATMFDINKTIMRCLVKNLAMFGLGLYIYAGEDLPESDEEPPKPEKKPDKGLKPISYDLGGIGNTPADEPAFKCDKCGKTLQPYTGKNGKYISIREHAEISKKSFAGKVWCLDCIEKYRQGVVK